MKPIAVIRLKVIFRSTQCLRLKVISVQIEKQDTRTGPSSRVRGTGRPYGGKLE